MEKMELTSIMAKSLIHNYNQLLVLNVSSKASLVIKILVLYIISICALVFKYYICLYAHWFLYDKYINIGCFISYA